MSYAAARGGDKAVTVLLEHQDVDVDVNLADNNGCTPLRWALDRGHEEVAKLLLKSPELDTESSDYETARKFIVYRTIIICFDGTWNDREIDQPFTNVTRLQGHLANKYPHTEKNWRGSRHEQILYYIDGIGTGTTWLGSLREGVQAAGMTLEMNPMLQSS